MPPIEAEEAGAASIDIDELWLRGGFPDSLTAVTDEDSYLWRQAFVRSYLERDVPMFAPRMPAATMGRLWTMWANGQGYRRSWSRRSPFFYRTADGAEIDLVIEQAGKPKVAIEIKRVSAPQAEHGFFVACEDLEIENRIVVGAGDEDYPAKGGVKVRTLLSAVNELRES